jgi:hypothetical protein
MAEPEDNNRRVRQVRNIDTGGGDYAEGNIDKRSGVFYQSWLTPHHLDLHRRMLATVRTAWIEGGTRPVALPGGADRPEPPECFYSGELCRVTPGRASGSNGPAIRGQGHDRPDLCGGSPVPADPGRAGGGQATLLLDLVEWTRQRGADAARVARREARINET